MVQREKVFNGGRRLSVQNKCEEQRSQENVQNLYVTYVFQTRKCYQR